MKLKHFFILVALLVSPIVSAQLYFPPNNTTIWETTDPETLNWCSNRIDDLYTYLEAENTKAFILLIDGKIVLEEYFNGHDANTNWYWASAGKTLTAYAVGIAQQENLLDITDPTSDFLGTGWTVTTPSQEAAITVRNQLTMTSGLDDGVVDNTCTDPTCLAYLQDPNTRWAYHNAPYTLLTEVVASAANQDYNAYVTEKIKDPIGMDGAFIPVAFNRVYFSTPRSMARFGLLNLAEGVWNGQEIINSIYFEEMTTTSQNLNESYGYLWWLNGKDSFMLPQTQMVFNGSISPNAPDDMYAALGANSQIINVIPSLNMVWIRMGEDPNNTNVALEMNDEIWTFINEFECNPLSAASKAFQNINAYPNPSGEMLYLNTPFPITYEIYNLQGQLLKAGSYSKGIEVSKLYTGAYFLKLKNDYNEERVIQFIKE